MRRRAWLRSITVAGVVLMIQILASCKSPTSEDRQRLRLLEARFGSEFTFDFEMFDVYVTARSRSKDSVPQEAAEAIYRAFWFTESGNMRKDTNYTYLNVYNREGVFQYQLWWDQNAGKFGRGQQEHY